MFSRESVTARILVSSEHKVSEQTGLTSDNVPKSFLVTTISMWVHSSVTFAIQSASSEQRVDERVDEQRATCWRAASPFFDYHWVIWSDSYLGISAVYIKSIIIILASRNYWRAEKCRRAELINELSVLLTHLAAYAVELFKNILLFTLNYSPCVASVFVFIQRLILCQIVGELRTPSEQPWPNYGEF